MAKYDEHFVEDLRKSIKELPSKPKRELTVREIVETLRPELKEKQKQGWSIKELAQFLAEKGIRLSAATLRDYLGGQKKRGTRDSSRMAKRKSDLAAEPSTSPANNNAKATESESNTTTNAAPIPHPVGFDEDV